MTDKELEPLFEAWGRRLWPAMSEKIDEAYLRLGSIIFCGDPSEVPNGSQALADWIDAKVGCLFYARCIPDAHGDDG